MFKVPNLAVLVDCWARLACYPRGSFYPISLLPPTRKVGITKTCFRTCSTCLSRSQASYTLLRFNPQFLFEANWPLYSSVTFLEETAPVKLSARPCLVPCFYKGKRLDLKIWKRGVSLTTNLPPTLHNQTFRSGPSSSKAPRGLFVQVWEGRIFTAIAISPSLSSRQSLSRSTFRAGLNSPDKEFRSFRYHWASFTSQILYVAI